MITLLSLCVLCLAALILIPVVLVVVGLPFLLMMALLPWLLRIVGVILLLKALFEQPTRWENFIPAPSPSALPLLIGGIVCRLSGGPAPRADPLPLMA